jgi:hypothetical protein
MAVDVLLDAAAGELDDDPARDSPDGDRLQQRRREEANGEPGPAAPPQPLARRPHVCRTATLPSGACVTRITPSIQTCVSLTSAQRPEVLRRPADVRVARDEHVGRYVSHYDSPQVRRERSERSAGVLP